MVAAAVFARLQSNLPEGSDGGLPTCANIGPSKATRHPSEAWTHRQYLRKIGAEHAE